MFRGAAIQTRKKARAQFPKKAMAAAAKTGMTRHAAGGPEKRERDCYDTGCMQPAERPPIRIRDLKKPNRKEQNQRNCNNSELEGRALSRRGWWTARRPSLQAEPKQNDR